MYATDRSTEPGAYTPLAPFAANHQLVTESTPNQRPRLRFPVTARMKHRRDFQRLFKHAWRARGADFSIALIKNETEHTRLGLSVGKRCWRGAVGRNRVRRIFRESFRLSLPKLPPGYDILMIATKPRLEPVLTEVQRNLVRLVHKAIEKGERRERERTAPTPAKPEPESPGQ